jgi:hypothetical protein
MKRNTAHRFSLLGLFLFLSRVFYFECESYKSHTNKQVSKLLSFSSFFFFQSVVQTQKDSVQGVKIAKEKPAGPIYVVTSETGDVSRKYP